MSSVLNENQLREIFFDRLSRDCVGTLSKRLTKDEVRFKKEHKFVLLIAKKAKGENIKHIYPNLSEFFLDKELLIALARFVDQESWMDLKESERKELLKDSQIAAALVRHNHKVYSQLSDELKKNRLVIYNFIKSLKGQGGVDELKRVIDSGFISSGDIRYIVTAFNKGLLKFNELPNSIKETRNLHWLQKKISLGLIDIEDINPQLIKAIAVDAIFNNRLSFSISRKMMEFINESDSDIKRDFLNNLLRCNDSKKIRMLANFMSKEMQMMPRVLEKIMSFANIGVEFVKVNEMDQKEKIKVLKNILMHKKAEIVKNSASGSINRLNQFIDDLNVKHIISNDEYFMRSLIKKNSIGVVLLFADKIKLDWKFCEDVFNFIKDNPSDDNKLLSYQIIQFFKNSNQSFLNKYFIQIIDLIEDISIKHNFCKDILNKIDRNKLFEVCNKILINRRVNFDINPIVIEMDRDSYFSNLSKDEILKVTANGLSSTFLRNNAYMKDREVALSVIRYDIFNNGQLGNVDISNSFGNDLSFHKDILNMIIEYTKSSGNVVRMANVNNSIWNCEEMQKLMIKAVPADLILKFKGNIFNIVTKKEIFDAIDQDAYCGILLINDLKGSRLADVKLRTFKSLINKRRKFGKKWVDELKSKENFSYHHINEIITYLVVNECIKKEDVLTLYGEGLLRFNEIPYIYTFDDDFVATSKQGNYFLKGSGALIGNSLFNTSLNKAYPVEDVINWYGNESIRMGLVTYDMIDLLNSKGGLLKDGELKLTYGLIIGSLIHQVNKEVESNEFSFDEFKSFTVEMLKNKYLLESKLTFITDHLVNDLDDKAKEFKNIFFSVLNDVESAAELLRYNPAYVNFINVRFLQEKESWQQLYEVISEFKNVGEILNALKSSANFNRDFSESVSGKIKMRVNLR